MLIKLCTQKRSMDGESSHQTSTDLSALRAEVTPLQNRINAPRKHDGRQSRNTATPRTSGRGDKHAQNCDIRDEQHAHVGDSGPRTGPEQNPRKGQGETKRECHNCGKTHVGKCKAPPAVCDFILPNGKPCGKSHLRRYCYYEDPKRCKDPKVRELVIKRLESLGSRSTSDHHMGIEASKPFVCTARNATPATRLMIVISPLQRLLRMMIMSITQCMVSASRPP